MKNLLLSALCALLLSPFFSQAQDSTLLKKRTPEQLKTLQENWIKSKRGIDTGIGFVAGEALFMGRPGKSEFSRWVNKNLKFPKEITLFPEGIHTTFVFTVAGNHPRAFDPDMLFVITPSMQLTETQLSAIKNAVCRVIERAPAKWSMKPTNDTVDISKERVQIYIPVLFCKDQVQINNLKRAVAEYKW